MQQLSVELTIPIPADSILIKKTEYEELQKDNLKGKKFTLKQLSERTGMSKTQLEELFEKPKVKAVADVRRGGFVSYPECQGSPWAFLASATIDFIDKNFAMMMSI